MGKMKFFLIVGMTIFFLLTTIRAEEDEDEKDPYKSLRKKSVLDYSEADLEKLYDQWEEDEEPLPDDELPEHKRPRPPIDMSKFDPNNPEGMLKMSKKGQTLMMFATVSGNPTERETEEISQIWQSSLFNAHVEVQRYVVGSDRVLFMLKDGATAWDIKDFLVDQDRCDTITIEGKDYYAKGSPKYNEGKEEKKNSDKKKKKKTGDSKKSNKKSENEINKNAKTEL